MKDGQPCSHHGCAHHATHPCEGCGRIMAQGPSIQQKYFDLKMLVRQLRRHEEDGPDEEETFIHYTMKRKELQKLVDAVVFEYDRI